MCRQNKSSTQSAIFADLFLGGGGEEQEASALLSKKGGRDGSIESQQKPNSAVNCMP